MNAQTSLSLKVGNGSGADVGAQPRSRRFRHMDGNPPGVIARLDRGRATANLLGLSLLIGVAYGAPFVLYEGGLHGFLSRSSYASALVLAWIASIYLLWISANLAYALLFKRGCAVELANGKLTYLSRAFFSVRMEELERAEEQAISSAKLRSVLLRLRDGRVRHLPTVLLDKTDAEVIRLINRPNEAS